MNTGFSELFADLHPVRPHGTLAGFRPCQEHIGSLSCFLEDGCSPDSARTSAEAHEFPANEGRRMEGSRFVSPSVPE